MHRVHSPDIASHFPNLAPLHPAAPWSRLAAGLGVLVLLTAAGQAQAQSLPSAAAGPSPREETGESPAGMNTGMEPDSPVLPATRPSRDKRFHVDMSFTGGGMMAVGTPRPAFGGGGGVDVRLLWRVHRAVRMGIRIAAVVGGMPWNPEGVDGEIAWVPGGNGSRDWMPDSVSYGTRATLSWLVGYAMAFGLGRVVDLDLMLIGLGSVFPLATPRAWFFQYIMSPGVGLGLTFDLGRHGPVALGLTLRVDYVATYLRDARGFFLPQAGLLMTF